MDVHVIPLCMTLIYEVFLQYSHCHGSLAGPLFLELISQAYLSDTFERLHWWSQVHWQMAVVQRGPMLSIIIHMIQNQCSILAWFLDSWFDLSDSCLSSTRGTSQHYRFSGIYMIRNHHDHSVVESWPDRFLIWFKWFLFTKQCKILTHYQFSLTFSIQNQWLILALIPDLIQVVPVYQIWGV